jgi:hypothetical protein
MATKKENTLNLFQKLLEIQKRVVGLGKDSKSFSYQYVSGSKVLEHIKPLMNEYGIILKQEVIDIENTRQDYVTAKGVSKTEILTKASMKFTWVDCETGDKDENYFAANGQNDFEKGLGSALTYAERYFLLKYFHISTDEDDIDNPNRKPEVVSKPTAKASHSTKATISDLSKVKEMLSKDREGTINILNEKYELTPAQRKELGL